MKLHYLLIALALPAFQAQAEHSELEYPCSQAAAVEFGVPQMVFEALTINAEMGAIDAATTKQSEQPGWPFHGPMQIHEYMIPQIAEAMGSSEQAIKENHCENFRAAAWFLMNPSGGNESSIWVAVDAYIYGPNSTVEDRVIVKRIRRIYEKLNAEKNGSSPERSEEAGEPAETTDNVSS